MIKKLLLFFILLYSILFTPPLQADEVEIFTSGGWFLTIGETDLIFGAGSNLKSTYLSPPDATLVDIKCEKKTSWSVYARKLQTQDLNDLEIFVRRTSDGEGKGSIEGGEYFIPLRESYTELFWGIGERIGITLQYKITGISINLSPGTKNFHINFIVEKTNKP